VTNKNLKQLKDNKKKTTESIHKIPEISNILSFLQNTKQILQ